MNLAPVGTHCILELYDVDCALLDNESFVRAALEKAAGEGMSTLLKLHSHKFQPQGVTGFALLAESHISIHTWPENGYAAVDVFTCGDTAKPRQACRFLVDEFKAKRHSLTVLTRGDLATPGSASLNAAAPKEAALCPAHN